jgi:hypothetical protein
MFGSFYVQRDAAISGNGGQLSLSVDTYACVLLAELLDRARVLAAVRRAGPGDCGEEPLADAVEVFLLDVEEARARGLRARLFSRTPSGRLDPWSVDPSDNLEDLGGELVPVATPRVI